MAQYIPDEHFKGVQNTKTECPLAFITPSGTDKAAEKRIETVRNWTHGWGGGWGDKTNKTAHFETIKNVPLTGFKIAEEIRRWSTSNVVWRINDPRGFQLEISSGNMAYLMSESVIDHGEIKSELQWVRNGAQNFLLPTDSEEYQKYIKITKAIKNKVTIKDIEVGDIFTDINGSTGMFLGGYHIVQHGSWDGKVVDTKRRYYMKVEATETEDEHLISKSAFKNISLVKKGKPEDNKDWSAYLNESDEVDNYYGYKYFSKKKPKIKEIQQTLRFDEIPKDQTKRRGASYKKHNDHIYTMLDFMGGNGQAQGISLDPSTNTIIDTDDVKHGNSFFHRTLACEKRYKEVSTNGVPVQLTVTFNGVDVII